MSSPAPDDCPQAPSFRAALPTVILHEACKTVGGIGDLADLLRVPPAALLRWLEGEENPPHDVYQACIEIVLLHEERR
jgi:hypothetical protein